MLRDRRHRHRHASPRGRSSRPRSASSYQNLDTNTQRLWEPPTRPEAARERLRSWRRSPSAWLRVSPTSPRDACRTTDCTAVHRWRSVRARGSAGGHGLWPRSLGLAVGLAVFFPFFALGGMGGGDVKLMAALGTGSAGRRSCGRRSTALWLAACWPRRRSGPRLPAPGAFEHRRTVAVLVGPRRPADAGAHARARARPSASLRIAHLRGPGGGAMATVTRRARWHSERGAELIEMVVVLPLLLLVLFGIIDFGFMFQRYVVLTNAAMEGARVGILPGYDTRRCGDAGRDRTPTTGGVPAGHGQRGRDRHHSSRAGRRHVAGRPGDRDPHLHLPTTSVPSCRSSAGRSSSVNSDGTRHHAPASSVLRRDETIPCHEAHARSSSSPSRCSWPAPPASWCSGRCRTSRCARSRSATTRWPSPPRRCRWAPCSRPPT